MPVADEVHDPPDLGRRTLMFFCEARDAQAGEEMLDGDLAVGGIERAIAVGQRDHERVV